MDDILINEPHHQINLRRYTHTYTQSDNMIFSLQEILYCTYNALILPARYHYPKRFSSEGPCKGKQFFSLQRYSVIISSKLFPELQKVVNI